MRHSPRWVALHEPARLFARAAAFACAALLGACGVSDLPQPQEAQTLVVAVRFGPATWFPGPDGTAQGLDHDLIERFAREQKLPLTVVSVTDAATLIERVAAGDAHVGIGGLYRPQNVRPVPEKGRTHAPLLWTIGYETAEAVLVHSREGFRPRGWKDLAGAAVAYVEASGIEDTFAPVRREHPEIRWQPMRLASADALLALVDEGKVDYAVVSSIDSAVGRNIYLDVVTAFPLGPRRELAWAVSGSFPAIAHELDAFLARVKRDGTLARLTEHYFAPRGEVARLDAGVFMERVDEVLPGWKPLFVAAQESTGIEWRLLAAVAYQESKWNPDATSETGVRGFMQLTEETARHLGVADRLDPRQSILAAARYLRDLKDRLPRRIAEPDRTWFALAAFNIGLGHLEDARVQAQRDRLDPDRWRDVRRTLPLLALPDYYEKAKLGYARGGMPVAFVDRVRAYYDILLRTQDAHQPRLRVLGAYAGP
ncbi:membrane-bound lytic murein transglycosylase F [Burkholderiales bacterium]|nr:membrane-bound lytic murein transglycosylase F [Burkholderiales bacterium]